VENETGREKNETMTKNFSIHEFNCKDGSPVPEMYFDNVQELAKNLQVIRDHIGEPLQILSGYRSPTHNKKVGGKSKSYHMKAMAADIACKSLTPKKLHSLILTLIAKGKVKNGGLGLYPGFVHYDIGPANRRW
jgi:uncharacterized protein YcbK (DUF882 family)